MTGEGDDDERAIETQRLVAELAEVRKRMQLRAEQPPLRAGGSGAFRAVGTPLPFPVASKLAAEAREAREARAARESSSPIPVASPRTTDVETKAEDEDDEAPPPPTRRRPG